MIHGTEATISASPSENLTADAEAWTADPAGTRAINPETAVLAQLPVGARARVRFDGMPTEEVAYLRALGLASGRVFSVCRRGTPCVVRVGATRIGLAGAVARKLCVECVEPGAA